MSLLVPLLLPIITIVFVFGGLIIWNRSKVKGKILSLIVRKDKSIFMGLCELRGGFMIFNERAYDIYPDYVRLARFPMGWPAPLQELVPTSLYDEEDAIPLDWVNIDKRIESSANLHSALSENWIRKLVQETATEGKAPGFNFKRILPVIIIGAGVLLLMTLVMLGSKGGCPIKLPGVG